MLSMQIDPLVAPSIQRNTAPRLFYPASVPDFLGDETAAVVGHLSSGHVAFHAAAEAEQVRTWEREVELSRPRTVSSRRSRKGRLKLSEAERGMLVEIGHRLGRKALADVATMARPDTTAPGLSEAV